MVKERSIEWVLIDKLKKYKSMFVAIEYNQHILIDDNVHRDILLKVNFNIGKIFYYDSNLEYIIILLKNRMEKQIKDSKRRTLDLINLNDLLDELEEKENE